MSNTDPNWNGGYNTAAPISPSSQYAGGVLPTDSSEVAFIKGQLAEQRSPYYPSGDPGSSNTGGGGEFSPEGIVILFKLGLMGLVIFLLWMAGSAFYESYKRTYIENDYSTNLILLNMDKVHPHEKSIGYVLMSTFHMDKRNRESGIESYINTADEFKEYREVLKPKLDKVKPSQRLKLMSSYLNQYRSKPGDKKMPSFFALNYYCQTHFILSNCSIFASQLTIEQVQAGKTFLPPTLCAPMLHLRLSRLRSYLNDYFLEVDDSIKHCSKLDTNYDTLTLKARAVTAGLLAKVLVQLPDEAAKFTLNHLVTLIDTVRGGIWSMIMFFRISK